MKVFLLGMPGSGKTTLGRQLATALQVAFVDLDASIEEEAGKSVQAIFREQGEPSFRKLEAATLQRWCTRKDEFVMATGGGAPCFENNLQVINRSGLSLFLDIPPAVIAERILKTDLVSRPLFANVRPENLKDNIEFLRSQRISFYNQAHVRIESETSVEEIVAMIKQTRTS